RILRLALDGDVGGADQREVALIGVHENDPLVVVLQQIGLVALPELPRDQMAALDQTDAAAAGRAGETLQSLLDPRTGGVDDATRGDGALLAPAAIAPSDVPS